MHKIITISREFGSGGRELGKRLAEELGIPCSDGLPMLVAQAKAAEEHFGWRRPSARSSRTSPSRGTA